MSARMNLKARGLPYESIDIQVMPKSAGSKYSGADFCEKSLKGDFQSLADEPVTPHGTCDITCRSSSVARPGAIP